MSTDYETKAYSTIQEAQLNYWSKIRHCFVAGLELTPFCNLRCVHCYMHGYTTHETLSAEQWISVIDHLYDEGVLILYMTGGEIFTRKDFTKIYLHAKKKGFIIELLTNVTCCTDEIIDVFRQYPPAVVSISVYGMSEDTYEAVTGVNGSFAKFMTNVGKLKDADIDIELKFIGLKENIKDLRAARDFAASIGAKFKYNLEIFPTLQGDRNVLDHRLTYEEIISFEIEDPSTHGVIAANVDKKNPFADKDEIPLFTCNVASTLCYIDALGYVSPCNKMRLKDHNILNEPLHEIWKDYIEKYAKMTAPKDYKCAKCPHVYICSPCPVINKMATDSFFEPCKEFCELAKMRVREFSKEKYDKFRKK